jgi:hypothetical protein
MRLHDTRQDSLKARAHVEYDWIKGDRHNAITSSISVVSVPVSLDELMVRKTRIVC